MVKNIAQTVNTLPPQIQVFLQQNGINLQNMIDLVYRKDSRSLSVPLLDATEVAQFQNSQDYIVAICGSSELPQGINYIVFAARADVICQLAGTSIFRSNFIRNGKKKTDFIFLNFNDENRRIMRSVKNFVNIIYGEF